MTGPQVPPILGDKHHDDPSAFTPENLLREARRQKMVDAVAVPKVCLLDPDGDIVRQLRADGRARRHEGWVCYHTDLWLFDLGGREIGVVGCAVGASFAVLVAEQMFASGCELLVSITSAGQIAAGLEALSFVFIDKALRDEGTSYHYLPSSDFAHAPEIVLAKLAGAFGKLPFVVNKGATWTTDAPYRETESAIRANRARGVLAVEMEAAALYAFAVARRKLVVCFAHVTNQMAQAGDDFEKGEADGALAGLTLLDHVVDRLIR